MCSSDLIGIGFDHGYGLGAMCQRLRQAIVMAQCVQVDNSCCGSRHGFRLPGIYCLVVKLAGAIQGLGAQPHIAHLAIANRHAIYLYYRGNLFGLAGNPHLVGTAHFVHGDYPLFNGNIAIAAQCTQHN